MKTDTELNQKLNWKQEINNYCIQNYDISLIITQNFYFICLYLTMVF